MCLDTVFIQLHVCRSIMANIKTEDEIIVFEREMKEFWTKLKSVYGTEQINQTLTLRDSCKESIKALSGEKASCSCYLCFFQVIIKLLQITEITFHYREMVQKAERRGCDA